MEIKRKFEMLVATNEIYVIRKSSTPKQTACAKCGEPMLTAQQAAAMFGIAQRRIFQIIEAGAAHFIETETGVVMICLNSLSAIVSGEMKKN